MRIAWLLAVVFAWLAPAASASAADPLRSAQWGLDMVGADAARTITAGSGANVAVIDTGGAFGHPDLQGRLVAGPDFVDGDANPSDGNGHGTHVAGIVAANAGNGIGVESVAPGARVLVIRALDSEGGGDYEAIAAGVRWATDNGAHVINLSVGPEVPLVGGSASFRRELDRALDRGVVVVAAAGNGLLNQGAALPVCEQPGGEERLLCVGAVDRNRESAYYSNYGYGLSLTAPGGAATGRDADDILSTHHTPTGLGPYAWMAGTSQATPHVAGVAALLASLGVHGEAARRRILETASDAGPAGPDDVYGAGIVNAAAAVAGLRGSVGSTGGGGAGGGPSGAGTPSGRGSAARVYVARVHRWRTVLRRGIRVSCLAAGAGTCRVRVYVRGRRIATGSRRVVLGRRATTIARLNRRGRLLARSSLRRRRSALARVYVSLPGARTIRRTIRLRP